MVPLPLWLILYMIQGLTVLKEKTFPKPFFHKITIILQLHTMIPMILIGNTNVILFWTDIDIVCEVPLKILKIFDAK